MVEEVSVSDIEGGIFGFLPYDGERSLSLLFLPGQGFGTSGAGAGAFFEGGV